MLNCIVDAKCSFDLQDQFVAGVDLDEVASLEL
jgi:hypothetical protein